MISFTIAMNVNFILNRNFNFRNIGSRKFVQFIIFWIVTLFSFLLQMSILYGLVDMGHIWYVLARAISIAIGTLFNFYFHNRITFNQKTVKQ
jgi:putative flippase GtrA